MGDCGLCGGLGFTCGVVFGSGCLWLVWIGLDYCGVVLTYFVGFGVMLIG